MTSDVRSSVHGGLSLPCSSHGAANLNIYSGKSSRVGWRGDDEPLCGKWEEANLIVSLSFGTHALFK